MAPVPTLSMPQLLWGLFFDPGVIFLLQHGRWLRAVRLMLAVMLITGGLMGAARFPGFWRTTVDWATWFGHEVGELRIQSGEINLARPATRPYTTRHRGWRIDFMARGTRFAPAAQSGPENRGIWIAPEKVMLWWSGDDHAVQALSLWDAQRLRDRIKPEQFWPEGLRVTETQVATWIAHGWIGALALYVLASAMNVLLRVGFYTVLFAVIPVLLRTPIGRGGFRQTLSFYAYASVPPMLMAAVYSSLDLPFLDYDSAFIFGFIVYLFMVVRGIRALSRPPDTAA